MIDRIEELLGLLAAEDEEGQEQEDVLALTVTEDAVPAAPHEDGEEAGEVGTDENRSRGWTVEATAPSRPAPAIGETKDGGWTVKEIVLERSGLIAGAAKDGSTEDRRGGLIAGGTATESAETARELWRDGPVWTVQSVMPETARTRRTKAAEQAVQMGEVLQPPLGGDLILAGLARAVRGGATGLALEGAGRSGPARSGLEGLYRQTVQGLRPAVPALPQEQMGKTVRVQEAGSAASLTVDELDRAVRRDSWRYDGGMSIY